MKYGFFIFIFIALAMTVMSAPAGKTNSVANTAQAPASAKKSKSAALSSSRNAGAASKKSGGGKRKRTICKRAQAALIEAKKKPSTSSRPAGSKGAKKTGKVRRDFNATTFDTELFRRSSGTKLCGLKLRAKTVGMCHGNPAYLYDRGTKTSVWYQWNTIKDKMTPANIPSKYQCDHALELQLTAAALTASGFCTAWDEMRAAWKKYDKHAKVDDIMSNLFFNGGFKAVVNHPTMLFFVDTSFNERKRAFTAAYLRGSAQASTTELMYYFNAGVVGIVDGIATAIDTAAYNLLDAINQRATPENYDEDTASQAAKDLVCALDSAQTVTFRSWEKAVRGYWDGMKEVLFPSES